MTPMTTAQEIFNIAVLGCLRQGVKSLNAGGPDDPPDERCAYRGAEGRKCPVGHVITDEEYREEMDLVGSNVEELYRKRWLPERLAPHISLLMDLQTVHDCRDPVEWASEFSYVAEDHSLEMPK